jgi:hypothetical protein
MTSINYKLISLPIEKIDEMINKVPNAPTKLRNFFITAGMLTHNHNEYGFDMFTAIYLIFKNKYNLFEESLKQKNIYEYICTFIIEESTNILIGTMTMSDNIIGTITIFPEFRNKGIATDILKSIFNIANDLNFQINIYPNKEVESIVKKIGFIYFPNKDISYVRNKYGEQSQLDKYVSKNHDTKSTFMIVNKKDYKKLFDFIGYNAQSMLNIFRYCGLINIDDNEKKEKFNRLLNMLSN